MVERSKEILIDAINPQGNLGLLLNQFNEVLRNYLKQDDQVCLFGPRYKGRKIVLREGDQNENPQGTRYRLRLSLEEDI